MSEMYRVHCEERYCDRPVTHYVQAHISGTMRSGGAFKLEGLKVPYCSAHAPEEARPIPVEWDYHDQPLIFEAP